MWDRLEVTYEGTNQVKEAKISMLVHEYEMFTLNENEDIKSMFSRFTNIINALQGLDKTYSNSEMVRKILRCLPMSWMPKVTAIEEAKNLNVLPLEDLLGSLMTHELSMQNKDDDEEKEEKKKKIVARMMKSWHLSAGSSKNSLLAKRNLVESQIRESTKREREANLKKSYASSATNRGITKAISLASRKRTYTRRRRRP
ncbi:UBN2 domain-containing protein [Cephalotus follicularis]|uniref:UBN2 domain-containing protein n=1 Tax=Cephalotus follicularis TaxID=3775 RepID=A0A1Q3B241_CEPFO|nr:UBN2 domain-containing protein [Cephalotus follicularis]